MDPQLSNDEQSMRKKILQQEFPFDKEAWEAMQRLLDDERDRVPLVPPLTPPTGSMPGPGSGRLWWWLLLLAIGAGSATLYWRQIDRQGFALSKSSDINPDTNIFSFKTKTDNPKPSLETKIATAGNASGETVKNSPEFSTQHNKQPKTHPDSRTEQTQNQKIETIKKTLYRNADQDQILHQQANTEIPKLFNIDSKPPSEIPPGNTDTPSISNSMQQPGNIFRADKPLEPLPTELLGPVVGANRPDSLIRPVEILQMQASPWEQAWILGANLNTVDYQPLRVSALPHLGYLLRYRLQPRTALQAEFIIKFVSGYDWRAEFYDVVPGGSAQVILENKHLLYFELPLLLHRSFGTGQSWLFGLKPGLALPIAPYGSFSTTNSGAPKRFYSPHEGIRYLDLGLVLGWEYRFGRRWALDIRYNQGLFDLTVDNFYHSPETHLNSDLQVSLRYFITKKIRKHDPVPH